MSQSLCFAFQSQYWRNISCELTQEETLNEKFTPSSCTLQPQYLPVGSSKPYFRVNPSIPSGVAGQFTKIRCAHSVSELKSRVSHRFPFVNAGGKSPHIRWLCFPLNSARDGSVARCRSSMAAARYLFILEESSALPVRFKRNTPHYADTTSQGASDMADIESILVKGTVLALAAISAIRLIAYDLSNLVNDLRRKKRRW